MKLILAPLGVSHTELDEFLVCDINSKECMIHRGPNCPANTEMLESKLYELIGDYDDETVIEFNQWTSTDRANLISRCENVPQFINLVIQQLKKLAAHSFIAKCKSNYLRECKENLEVLEVQKEIMTDFKLHFPYLSHVTYFLMGVRANIKTVKIFTTYATTSLTTTQMLNGCFVQQAMENSHVME